MNDKKQDKRGGRNGNQKVYTPELAAEICRRIAAGESLRSICRSEGMPDESTVREWAIDDHNGFAPHYARSTLIRMHGFSDEILEIIDNCSSENVMVARARVDTRRWLMSKIAPKIYGDKLDLTHAAPDGGPVQFITIYEK
jgi:hypothetical protein